MYQVLSPSGFFTIMMKFEELCQLRARANFALFQKQGP